MSGEYYILFLSLLLAAMVAWAGICLAMRFVLTNYLSIISDRLYSMALKDPLLENDNDFIYAKMINHSHLVAARIKHTYFFLHYLNVIEKADSMRNGNKYRTKHIESIKNDTLKSMTTLSSACFLMLLLFGSFYEVRMLFSCILGAFRRSKARRESMKTILLDDAVHMSSSYFPAGCSA